MSTLQEAIRVAINNAMLDYYSALPGRVEKYDYKKQKATIKPLLRQRYNDGTKLEIEPIVNVPVSFTRSGKASLTLPIEKGDTGLLIFCSRSIDTWLSKGGVADIDNPRIFDLSDAVFLPGMFPFSEDSYSENDTDLLLIYDQFKIKIDKTGKLSIGKGGVELLDLISQLIDVLSHSTVATQAGPQLLSKVLDGTVANIKAKLAQIKGSL